MHIRRLSPKETLKALAVGLLTALLLSAVMVPAFKLGIAPMPKPPSLAFAQLLLGPNVPWPCTRHGPRRFACPSACCFMSRT